MTLRRTVFKQTFIILRSDAMRLLFSLILIVLLTQVSGQEVKIYETFSDFESVLQQEDDKVHIVNFWATWCAPCIKEMPYFDKLQEKYPDKVEVVFVSLDFRNQYESRLVPFVHKKGYKSQVVMLGDPKVNDWIDKVDPSWSGAIPATYMYKGDQVKFEEKEYHSIEELESDIEKLTKS